MNIQGNKLYTVFKKAKLVMQDVRSTLITFLSIMLIINKIMGRGSTLNILGLVAVCCLEIALVRTWLNK